MKFTFRKQPRATGLAAVTETHPDTDIKLGGLVVGSIDAPHHTSTDGLWKLRFAVTDASQKCGWRWVTLKYRPKDEPAGRAYVNERFEQINALGLHKFPKE